MSEKSTTSTAVQSGKVTPMMEQFVEIKAANPDSLLFYRMGDFYELFFEDAEIASRALGITLTKRGKHLGEDIPMCGVPFHAADDYLMKLIRLGHRVSVCEQLEKPSEAKKRGGKSVVKRGVVRLVTSGTLTDDKLLDPAQSNYLCALAKQRLGEHREELALAWIDLSTGAFLTTQTTIENLHSELSRIEPSELILSQNSFEQSDIREIIDLQKFTTTPLPGNLFDSGSASRVLCDYFDVQSLDGFGSYSKCELAAAAAILGYVQKTQISERPALRHPQSQHEAKSMVIDAATRANLELTKTLSGERQGSLLKAIDRTLTGPGARALAQQLMAPLTVRSDIIRRLDSVSFLNDSPSLLQEIRSILKGAPDMARALSRLALNRGGPRDIDAIGRGFETAREIEIILSKAENAPAQVQSILKVLGTINSDLVELLDNTLAGELPLLARDGGFIKPGYDVELDQLRTLRDESRQIIAALQVTYSRQSTVKALKIRHNNVLGYFIEVTASNAAFLQTDELKGEFIHRQTLANVMRFTTTELAELESKIANAAGRALEIELKIFEMVRQKLVEDRQTILAVADALATLDVFGSHAKLAAEQNYCRPDITDGLDFKLVNGRHPVIEQVLQKDGSHPFVANDSDIGAKKNDESGAIWLLTGPNMGGKSTFLRQNALIALMAQMGSFVPADEANVGIVDRLFSRVGASDDLARGRSTFMVEMVETAAILNQATVRSFVILDEIGRGTATFDGLSIAWAAIEHLHAVNQCRTIFATHYHELVALSEPLTRLTNVTMKVKEWQGDVVFLHEVVSGAADRSYGIQVAKLAGLPEAVIERAKDVLQQLEGIEREKSANKIIDDLPLFSVDQKPAQKPVDKEGPISIALAEIAPDELSPREALDKLYQLRAMLQVETKS